MTLLRRWPTPVRASDERWSWISALLIQVERGLQAAAQLDALERLQLDPRRGCEAEARRRRAAAELDRQLHRLERRIDHELDRLTVERLLVDLADKQARWGPAPAPA